MYASRQGGKYVFTRRAQRTLQNASAVAIKGSLQDLFDAWIDGLNNSNLGDMGKEADICVSTPCIPASMRPVNTADLTRRLVFGATPNQSSEAAAAPLITPPVDLTDDVEDDEMEIDVVLTEIKEQTILQNLLFKNVLDKNQRVLTLEHKNGRKLRLFIPPDSQSTKAFVDDANCWVNHMLHTDVQRKGMLMYLAKTQPKEYISVANKKKLRISNAVLNTPQTMALGRLTGINNTQMAKLRSFLRNVGNAQLKLSKAELLRIDYDVGLHPQTPDATFDTYTLEWSTTNSKGVEKKAPEHCNYWTCDLLVEVASEIDLLYNQLFFEKVDMTAVPSLDYSAPGFVDKEGIVVLFGGDHGAGNCPCSLKLNFTQLATREEALIQGTLRVTNGQITYNVGHQQRTINVAPYFNDVLPNDLAIIKVISNFNDLYVGDLAFLSMTIGMNNSSGAHCLHCKRKARESIREEDVRTKLSLTECLNEYITNSLARKGVRNHLGVNTVGLLDIDPKQIVVPILHCPMGLVDKVSEFFKAWTILEVKALPQQSNVQREAYKNARFLHLLASSEENQARLFHEETGTVQSAAAYTTAKTAKANAKREESKSRINYDEMTKRHNARLFSLSQAFDTIFRNNGIKKEHYHGGKYNGVNCMRIMDKAESLFTDFCDSMKEKKLPSITNETITTKCNEFARLLSLMDVIWSNVRGIDAGLLPTNEQIEQLRKALAAAKTMWLSMNIGTLQPKWHLTFDGHLLQQVIAYGGLADKADDTIEFQHQILKKLRDRYGSVTSFQRREGCMRKELRRSKSSEIQSHVDKYEASIKVKATSKRVVAATERRQEVREAKRVKRETVMQG